MFGQMVIRKVLNTHCIITNGGFLTQSNKAFKSGRCLCNNLQKRCVLTCDFKNPLTHKWLQNPHMMFYRTAKKKIRQPYTKPLCFNYAGDLKTLPNLDPETLLYEYQKVEELEKVPPVVKKQFTIGYAPGKQIKYHRIEEMYQSLDDRLRGDCNMEREIAAMTIKIRNQIPRILAERHNKKHKHQLVIRIEKRRKMLKKLRKLDYERFLWLLKDLQIKYVPIERLKERQTQHSLLVQQAKNDALEMRNNKLKELKEKLEEEKIAFLKEKEDVMREIEEDIQRLDLNKEDLFKNIDKLREEKYNIERKSEEVTL